MQAPQPIYVGVDPAFRKGGFWAAVYDAKVKRIEFHSFDLLTWHDWLRSAEAPDVCFVLVENSNLQNLTFNRHLSGGQAERIKKSRNVGANQAVSELAYQSALRRYGPRYAHQVSPEDKGQKLDARMFDAVMRQEGIELPPGSIGQDQRDAGKLALLMQRKALHEGLFKINEPAVHYNPGNY